MIKVYCDAAFSKAWLTPERIQVIAEMLNATWGPEKFGSETPSRAFSTSAWAKLLAKRSICFEMGKPSWTDRRAKGSVDYGRVEPHWEDRLGRMQVFLQLGSEAERRELHTLYEWWASLPECALVLGRRGFDRLSWTHSSAGICAAGTTMRMVLAFRGVRLMRPFFSNSTTIRWTLGGVTPKKRCMSASAGGCPLTLV